MYGETPHGTTPAAVKSKPRNNASANQNTTDDKKTCISPENYSPQESDLFQRCRKLGIHFQAPPFNETKREHSLRVKRNKNKIAATEKKFHISAEELPPLPFYQKMLTSIRSWTACEHLK